LCDIFATTRSLRASAIVLSLSERGVLSRSYLSPSGVTRSETFAQKKASQRRGKDSPKTERKETRRYDDQFAGCIFSVRKNIPE
jgi:hypothetical protein